MVGKRLGCGKSLGTCCSAVGCSMRTGTNLLSQIKMFSFPKEQERLNAWISAVKRKEWKPTRKSLICSRHFITGKPSLKRNHPDWAPSVFPDRDGIEPERNLARYERAERREESISQNIESSSLPSSSFEDNNTNNEGSHEEICHSSTLTDLTMGDISKLNEEIIALKKTVAALRLHNSMLLASAKKGTFASQVLSSDKKCKFYTGLNKESFKLFLNLLRPLINNNINLSYEEQLIVVLSKLRLGLLFEDLGTRLEVATSVVNKAFHSVLDIIFANLKHLVFWPSKQKIKRNVPSCFIEEGFSDVACVIDCSEIFIETPKNLIARAQTYSQYKHHNTVKFLIAISPAGGVSFVSRCWGGRVSDKELTQNCGFLDHLSAGDTVMADRGFQIQDVLSAKGVVLRIPASTRNLNQLSAEDVLMSRKLSRVRVHIERVIRKIYEQLSDSL